MNKLDEKLYEYVMTFGENFPTMEYTYCTAAQIIEMIDDCLRNGEPMESTTAEDITL